MTHCVKCQIDIDKDAPIPFFGIEFSWSTVGEFLLCDSCISEILNNWLYSHVNKEGELKH